MPKMDGREALQQIKANPALRQIPIVVLTTSQIEEDSYRTSDLGVNSCIGKPVTFVGLVAAMQTIGRHWFAIVDLPGGRWGTASVLSRNVGRVEALEFDAGVGGGEAPVDGLPGGVARGLPGGDLAP